MDEESVALGGGIIVSADRRLNASADIPSGPPGAENDHFEPCK